ncbi:MAG: panB [Hyphomicrobiales bacterium]|nr:panB [Hyphomicrobiales bacterium]
MTYLKDASPEPKARKAVTLAELGRMRAQGEKIAMLTCYDSSFASLLERCGVDVLLVGDSMGNVLQGHRTTLPVTLEQMEYHTGCVSRVASRALVISDMTFGSYQESMSQAMRNAARLMAAGAQMVKIEGGAHIAETVAFLVERGVPVCAHIGLTPQSVHQLGGYRVQGATEDSAKRLRDDALALEQAGAALVVMEMMPAKLGGEITHTLTRMATIGIGAGPDCSGQVLVLHDMLGVYPGKKPRFTKDFMPGAGSIEAAVAAYVQAVKAGTFPGPENCY